MLQVLDCLLHVRRFSRPNRVSTEVACCHVKQSVRAGPLQGSFSTEMFLLLYADKIHTGVNFAVESVPTTLLSIITRLKCTCVQHAGQA